MDYGGTVDTAGVHWGELFWTMYQRFGVPVSKEAFRQAYVFGEKALALEPLVKPEHSFYTVLQLKLQQQFAYLHANNFLPASNDATQPVLAIAKACDAYAINCIAKAKPVLKALAEEYPMVMVSNFYGNLNAVLKAYGIAHFFNAVVESAVVGVRKPDPQIFTLGIKALGFASRECAAVGDSYRKDIRPAKEAGCYTVWLKGEGWEEDPAEPVAADRIINSFEELLFLKFE